MVQIVCARSRVVVCVVIVSIMTVKGSDSDKANDVRGALRGAYVVHNHNGTLHSPLFSALHGLQNFFGTMWKEIQRPAYEHDEGSVSFEHVLRGVVNTTMQSCNVSEASALELEGATFDTKRLVVQARGILHQSQMRGGNVSVRVKMGTLYGNITTIQRLKRRMMWTFGEQRRTWEPLCKNLARGGVACPLNKGTQDLHLSLSHLPELRFRAAGDYSMEVRAYADDGKLLTCLNLQLPAIGMVEAQTATTTSTTVTSTTTIAPMSFWKPWQVVRV